MPTPIYLDYASTTPVDPRVAQKMSTCLASATGFGNSSSKSHQYGWDAEEIVEEARFQLSDLLHCDPREIVWTSGATESDNLAIKGVVEAACDQVPCHVITSTIEHKAVLDVCTYLEARGDCSVTWLDPQPGGRIAPASVQAALRPETRLVSLMHVNNELGTINDIENIGRIARQAGVLFHSDAAQSCGKLPLDLASLPVDLVSISAHKMYGPKGVGALFVRLGTKIAAQVHGGGHERNMRSGTLAVHQILGMGEAARLCHAQMAPDDIRIRDLRARFLQGLQDLPEVGLNSDREHCLPGIVNLSFPTVLGPGSGARVSTFESDVLLTALAPKIAVSSGSACTSATVEPSYVLRALGLKDTIAHTSIRFSFGRYTSPEDIDQAIAAIRHAVTRLSDPSRSA